MPDETTNIARRHDEVGVNLRNSIEWAAKHAERARIKRDVKRLLTKTGFKVPRGLELGIEAVIDGGDDAPEPSHRCTGRIKCHDCTMKYGGDDA